MSNLPALRHLPATATAKTADARPVADVIGVWLASKRKDSERTFRQYRLRLERFFGWLARNGGDPLQEILTQRTVDLKAYLLTLPTPSVQGASRAVIRGAYRELATEGLVAVSPAECLRPIRNRDAQVRHHPMAKENTLRDALDSLPDDLRGRRDRLILLLGSVMGLRRGEIAGLRLRDVAGDTLTVTGKGRKVVSMPIPPSVAAALQSYLDLRAAEYSDSARDHWKSDTASRQAMLQPSAPLIVAISRNGAPRCGGLCGENVWRVVKRLVGLAPHSLRVRAITQLYRNCRDLSLAQSWARHSSISTTQIYVREDRVRDAAAFVADIEPGEREGA